MHRRFGTLVLALGLAALPACETTSSARDAEARTPSRSTVRATDTYSVALTGL